MLKTKSICILFCIVILSTLIFSLPYLFNKSSSSTLFNKTLTKNKVTQSGMWIYTDKTEENVYTELNNQEVNHVISFLNTLSTDSAKRVEHSLINNSTVIAEIVFILSNDDEIRIMYDKISIFITKSYKDNQVNYILESPNLNDFFDEKLSNYK